MIWFILDHRPVHKQLLVAGTASYHVEIRPIFICLLFAQIQHRFNIVSVRVIVDFDVVPHVIIVCLINFLGWFILQLNLSFSGFNCVNEHIMSLLAFVLFMAVLTLTIIPVWGRTLFIFHIHQYWAVVRQISGEQVWWFLIASLIL